MDSKVKDLETAFALHVFDPLVGLALCAVWFLMMRTGSKDRVKAHFIFIHLLA